MKRTIILLSLFLLASLTAMSQSDTVVSMSDGLSTATSLAKDTHHDGALHFVRPSHPLHDYCHLTDTTKPWKFHLSMGGAYIGSKYTAASVFGLSPSVVYRPNDKFTFKSSAAIINSFSLAPGGYTIHGRPQRNLAPYRDPSALAGAINISASYKINDRLWLAGSVMFVGGRLASGAIINPWFTPDMPVDLNATAVTAAMRYRIGNDSFIDFHMTFIDDRTGALGPILFGGPYGSPYYYNYTAFGSHLFQ